MLRYLRIANLAVISDVRIEFEPGLNLLTGETGSGKSIIVDALSLLLGARSSQDMIRSGESRGSVEGMFQLEVGAGLPECLLGAGIEASTGEIIIRRELQREGPGRVFVNDRLVTVSLLRDLRPRLIDIHGQGDHQTLLLPAAQLGLLDALAEAVALRRAVNEVFHLHRQKNAEMEGLARSEAERWRLQDVYGFQISEIERADPQPGEDEELERQRRVLQQAEKLARLTSEAYQMLYEADDSMLAIESQVRRLLQELRQIDDRFESTIDHMDRARIAVQEAAFFLRGYRDEVDCSPERLQLVEDRLAYLQRLKRKYGPALSDVLLNLERMKLERSQLLSSDGRRENLEKELSELKAEYLRVAGVLTGKRMAGARRLERAVVKEMKGLAMEQGRMVVSFDPVKETVAENGLERVEFLVSLNPGEEPKALSRIASGGEVARLMLAIKSVAASDAGAPSLVFDEIDVGIGGRVAERVGMRLRELARHHQVFCVTHQAQIARFADAHFYVVKDVVGGRTLVRVERLDREGRINELARMMAGARITSVTRRHARELLQAAP